MIPVCALQDIPAGEAVRIDADVPIAVFNVDGTLYAIDDTCTHQDASLADGWVEDCARSTHPGSTYAREASTPRQPSCRSAPTK